jgi:hypothetical protein
MNIIIPPAFFTEAIDPPPKHAPYLELGFYHFLFFNGAIPEVPYDKITFDITNAYR